jgi:urease accessory protein
MTAQMLEEQALDTAALVRLQSWLSPAFPVGAFSYSHGLEWAIETGDITDAATLRDWLVALLREGGPFADAVLFTQGHRAAAASDDAALVAVCDLAAAFAPARERHLETTQQGRAFAQAAMAAWPCAALTRLDTLWKGPLAYPVAVGVAAAGHGIAEAPARVAFVQAIVANLVSAGVRLVPLGQTDGLRIVAGLEPAIADCAARAAITPLDDLGGAALRSDLAAMHHETQYTRLFRS